MSRKGFLDILAYIEEKANPYYIDIVRHAIERKLVESRSQADVALNTFSTYRLVERAVTQDRPVRTTYKITKKGKTILHNLLQIRNLQN